MESQLIGDVVCVGHPSIHYLDYRLFALMLTGRSLETHKKQFGGKASLSQLTMSDADKVMSSVTTDLDKVVQILRNIPKEMLLVFRLVLLCVFVILYSRCILLGFKEYQHCTVHYSYSSHTSQQI